MCCQKVAEAEAMVSGGIQDVFISNEVVAPSKITRMVALAAQGARVSVVVDALQPLEQLAVTAQQWGTSIDVLVEINAGQDRCGVDTPGQAARLAEHISRLSSQLNGSVNFKGIQAYHGGLQHVRDPQQRAAAVQRVVAKAAAAVDAINKKAGLKCQLVTGGGSGTYRLEAASGVFNEVQPGSFAFGDADYARNLQLGGQQGEWQQSLWVLTQVMSVSAARACAVVDAGLKAVSLDSGPPVLLETPNVAAGLVAPPPGSNSSSSCSSSGPSSSSSGNACGQLPAVSFEGVEFQNGGDEHGKLLWPQAIPQLPPQLPSLGTKLLLQPGHCDPTANMYDSIVAEREGTVVAVWPVAGRGPGL
uniref:D-serine dehydratase-like domain-containing protein n=1 Tax=Tetradesmus obliquus TaxID=3088 RepID=A0A383VFH8_TETOB|eukprot:jgi/Sobl393_1/19476/SZX64315.1